MARVHGSDRIRLRRALSYRRPAHWPHRGPRLCLGAARAYNDWLAETYLRRDSRFKGIALLPMHDAEAALEELHHAYTELGMCGVLFPATGVHLNLGAKPYWPVYAEAARLGCPIVVHGGGHWDLGMETMNVSTGANAIGHPMSLAIALAEMVLNNLFDHFPGLRVAYLEGGPLWFLMALERLSRSYEAGIPINPRGELLHLPEGQTVADYIRTLIQAGRLTVGIEGGESDLAYAIKVAGEQAFMFSSDFPHEVNVQTVRKEIGELREREEISEAAKQAVLRGNAARFYGWTRRHTRWTANRDRKRQLTVGANAPGINRINQKPIRLH